MHCVFSQDVIFKNYHLVDLREVAELIEESQSNGHYCNMRSLTTHRLAELCNMRSLTTCMLAELSNMRALTTSMSVELCNMRSPTTCMLAEPS